MQVLNVRTISSKSRGIIQQRKFALLEQLIHNLFSAQTNSIKLVMHLKTLNYNNKGLNNVNLKFGCFEIRNHCYPINLKTISFNKVRKYYFDVHM